MSKTINQQIRAWWDEILPDLCARCETRCCNTDRHDIDIKIGEEEAFRKAGVPIYMNDDISRRGRDLDADKRFFIDSAGKRVEPPALVEIAGPEGKSNGSFELYTDSSGNCPLYDCETGKCGAHQDGKPLVCRMYPIFTSEDNPHLKQNQIIIATTCWQLANHPRLKWQFLRSFPGVEIKGI